MSDITTVPAAEETRISISTKDLPKEDRKMLRSMFWRVNALYALWAGQAQAAASGFLFTLEPVINRFYKDDPEKRRQAMVRHTSWFNVTLTMCPLIAGIVAAMERDNASTDDFDVESINAVKASLMGPLSGVGDAIFWGVLRVIAASVGVALAAGGSPLGPIAFLLIFNGVSLVARWILTVLGWKVGNTFIAKVSKSGLMNLATQAVTVLGLIMIGAMAASYVSFNIGLTIPMPQGDPVSIQSYIDTIFKGLIPLALTFLCFKLLKKNVNVILLIFGLIAFGLICGLLGIVA